MKIMVNVFSKKIFRKLVSNLEVFIISSDVRIIFISNDSEFLILLILLPFLISPLTIFFASGSSRYFCIALFIGLAPNSLSNPLQR